MQIKINDVLLSKEATDNQTLGEIYSQIKDEIHSSGKVITGVCIDGKHLPHDWKGKERLKTSVSALSLLEIAIDTEGNVRKNMLHDSANLTTQLLQKTAPLARKFRIGDEVIANNDLAQFLDEVKLIFNTMDHTTRNSSKNETPQLRQEVVKAANELVAVLDRIYKAQAAGDYIAIADELEYDMNDQMKVWAKLLSETEANPTN